MVQKEQTRPFAAPVAMVSSTAVWQVIVAALILATVSVVALTAVIHFSRVLQNPSLTGGSGDYAIFAEMTRTLAEGRRLYVDYWDIKPPGQFLYLTPFVWIFGNTPLAIYAGTVVVGLAFTGIMAALAYQLTGSKAAALAGGTLALLLATFQRGPETTFLMMTLGAGAALCATAGRGRALWMLAAGLLLAAGVVTKQPLIVEFPALLALAAWRAGTRWRRAIIGVIAGFALGGGLIALWAWSQGILEALWYRNVTVSAQYVFTSDAGWHFRDDSAFLFQRYFIAHTLPYLTPLLALGAVALVVVMARRANQRLVAIVLAWCALAFMGASIARGWRPPYFNQTFPSLIALIAVGVASLRGARLPWQAGVMALALFVTVDFVDRYPTPRHDWVPKQPGAEQPVIDLIETYTEPDDCLWMWGNLPLFNFLTGRDSCASAAHNGFVMDSTTFPIEPLRREFMRDLFERPPALHVRDDTWGYFPELEQYAARYLGEPLYVSDQYAVYAVDRSAWHPTYASFGGEIALIGYDLPPQTTYCPGDSLRLTLTWQQLAPPGHLYHFFAQLLTPDEQARLAGYDGSPDEERPTDSWLHAGEIVLGPPFELTIPADVEPGAYPLVVGLYDVATLERVQVTDNGGEGTYARLTTIEMGEPSVCAGAA